MEELKAGVTTHGMVSQDCFVYYYFELTDDTKVINITYNLLINRLCPENEMSDPDLYISKQCKKVDTMNYTWKSGEIGMIEYKIYPNDKNYSKGQYYIGVHGSMEGENAFNLTIRLSQPCIYSIHCSIHN